MLNIAIHNLHKLPQLAEAGRGNINGYALELIARGYVKYLYFDDYHFLNAYGSSILDVISRIFKVHSPEKLGIDMAELIFSPKKLRSRCDVLLNFNVTREEEFTGGVKKFDGLKIFHAMDHFWIDPASRKNKNLVSHGVDYLLAYSRYDRYCKYFQHYFPTYRDKVIPVPFGFTERFVPKIPFGERKKKCVAMGSILPLCRLDADPRNWAESKAFYIDEAWLHKFRRMLVLNREKLGDVMDSMLPEYPQITDHKYDMVEKLNEYQMFACCETLFNFSAAKTWEGPAAGTVLVCSDHPCYTDFGFTDGVNCIRHRQYDVDDFRGRVAHYITDQDGLQKIQETGTTFVRENFTHKKIADNLFRIISKVHSDGINMDEAASYYYEEKEEISSYVSNKAPQAPGNTEDVDISGLRSKNARGFKFLLGILPLFAPLFIAYELFRSPMKLIRFFAVKAYLFLKKILPAGKQS